MFPKANPKTDFWRFFAINLASGAHAASSKPCFGGSWSAHAANALLLMCAAVGSDSHEVKV